MTDTSEEVGTAVRAGIRDFMEAAVSFERVREADEASEPLLVEYRKLASAGWLHVGGPTARGGDGSFSNLVSVLEEVAYKSYCLASLVGRTVAYAVPVIDEWGTEDARSRYVAALMNGEVLMSLAMSEPDFGSDAGGIQLRGKVGSGSLRLNGEKIYCSGGLFADFFLVTVRTDPGTDDRTGITAVLVDRDTPGVTVRPIPAMGLRSNAFSSITFDNVDIDFSQVLGEVNEGWSVISAHLVRERIGLAAKCLGSMRHVFEIATKYSRERVQFGKTLASMPTIRELVASMALDMHNSRLSTYHAATMYQQGKPSRASSTMAKLQASEAYFRASDRAMQILGGFGYTNEAHVERHFRDSRALRIGGGTSEILRIALGSMVAKGQWVPTD